MDSTTDETVLDETVLDDRFTWGLIVDVFDVLTAHGYRRHSDRATGAAVGVLGDLCRVYEGKAHR
ncbi:hypothetical protein [Nonomuraea sp. NPDC049480]|uniref:hypothetical protein n=1 Tax=Nonomuraea sp. NPDC049480 TaxID=3364353 RepID=UPI003787AC31